MIGIVIVTHGDLGAELLRTAQEIVGKLPHVEAVSIHAAEQIEKARKKIETVLQRVSDGSGVLILTDLFGGTPSNLVLSYLEEGKLEVVTGVNLPMLMKLPALREERDLRALADKLARYGQRSPQLIKPNPTNGETNFDLNFENRGQYSIKIVNEKGNEIQQIKNDTFDIGKHEISWDASQLPAGVYFIVVKGRNFSETYKFIKQP